MKLVTNWRSKPGSLLSPRGTSGERAAGRGTKLPPLPDPLLLLGGEREEACIRFAQPQPLSPRNRLNLKAIWNKRSARRNRAGIAHPVRLAIGQSRRLRHVRYRHQENP